METAADRALSERERNLFGVIRLALALSVVASHLLERFGLHGIASLNGRMGLGDFGVVGFFGISGFLVTESATKRSAKQFWFARISRLYPAFVVTLTLSAFAIAALIAVDHNPLRCVWGRDGVLSYVLSNLTTFIVQDRLSCGQAIAVVNTVNGSLWTLTPELICYFIVWAITLCTRRVQIWLSTSIVASLLFIVMIEFHIQSEFLIRDFWWLDRTVVLPALIIGAAFMVGALLQLTGGRRFIFSPSAIPLLAIVWIVSITLRLWYPVGVVTVSALAVAVGLRSRPKFLGKIATRNDYSFGIYLVHYPMIVIIERIGIERLHLTVQGLMVVLFSWVYAFVCWHRIESPVMRRISRSSVSAKG